LKIKNKKRKFFPFVPVAGLFLGFVILEAALIGRTWGELT